MFAENYNKLFPRSRFFILHGPCLIWKLNQGYQHLLYSAVGSPQIETLNSSRREFKHFCNYGNLTHFML